MEANPSTSHSSCSCLSSSSKSNWKTKCCHGATEIICSVCLLCICCPLATAWRAMKLPCKVVRCSVRFVKHRACCMSEERVFAVYSSFSDIDSDTQMGKEEKTLQESF
ncbi:hypothetical protein NMG60_11017658 [Bertholletia excelsa]